MSFNKKKLVLYSMAAITVLVLCRALLDNRNVRPYQLAREFVASTITMVNQGLTAVDSPTIKVYVFDHKFPHSVYYVWCHPKNRRFEFRNYLSVMSVLQNIKPSSVIFFYNEYPVIDSQEYNTWLDDIVSNVPSFQTRKAPAYACLSNAMVNRTYMNRFLNVHKGIGLYIEENTVITSNSSYRLSEFCRSHRDSTTEPSILCSSASVATSKQSSECHLASKLANETYIPLCLVIDKSIFPKNIWTDNGVLSRASRKIFYGTEDVLQPKPSYTELAPNIAHMIWMGGGKMDFLFYLGVLSLLYVVEVDKVFVHGNLPPTGYYWSLFENDTRVEHIHHEPITMIYGKEVQKFPHMSDIFRVELMIKHGGIYMDTDAVFVKPLDKRLRAYDAVATYDWWDGCDPFPDFINFGVSIGKKGARFWHLFQETMRNFRDDIYLLNGLLRPYKVMEKHPDLILIEPRLQLQCFQLRCHPTWVKNFHNHENHHLNPSVKIDWKTDAYVYHWTSPTPKELSSFHALIKGNGVFAEIGKFIMNKSGMMKFFLQQDWDDTEHPI